MLQIFCFGASTVYGVGTSHGSWADKLKSQTLVTQYARGTTASGEKVEVYNLGIPGEKSDQMLARLKNEIKARQAFHTDAEKLAIITCGTNDSKALGSPDGYVMSLEEFSKLTEGIIVGAKGLVAHVIGLGLTPVDDTKTSPMSKGETYFSSDRIKQFESAYQKVCKGNGINFIPLFDIADKADWKNAYLYKDGLHSNDNGHQWIVDKILPELQKIIAL